jgi:hypothetical protein
MTAWLDDLRTSARHGAARSGILACLAAVLMFAAALASWWPAERARSRAEAEIALKRRSLAQARQAQELLEAYGKAVKEVAALEKKLDYAATQAQLVQSFSRLARRHGVRIFGETYEETRGTAQLALGADLALQGRFPALRGFLSGLSGLPTWSEVLEVRLESASAAGEQKGHVRIVTYRNARGGSVM